MRATRWLGALRMSPLPRFHAVFSVRGSVIAVETPGRRTIMPMKWREFCEIGCELPGVSESTWYRTPSLPVLGRSFVRPQEGLETLVFLVADLDERDLLLAAEPERDVITDHYRNAAAVLAHLEALPADSSRERLGQTWRKRAPNTAIRAFDENGPR
jgi:hypothetical protein